MPTVNSLATVNSRFNNLIIHEKIIYAKRHGLTNKQLEGIMQLEISNFIQANPGFEFEKVGEVKRNPDQSTTYPIHFRKNISK